MSRLVDDFFAFLHVERGMSAHTLDAYRRDIGALIAWGCNRQWVRLLRWIGRSCRLSLLLSTVVVCRPRVCSGVCRRAVVFMHG